MNKTIEYFFEQFFKHKLLIAHYTEGITPKSMVDSEVDIDGYYRWKPVKGKIKDVAYEKLEQSYGLSFPKSFIQWHKRYFFFGRDCRILNLPSSSPSAPLQEIIHFLNNDVAKALIAEKLYPFGEDTYTGKLMVFDARIPFADLEYPIRVYDGNGTDLYGLSEVVFSSFPKLLECLTYLFEEIHTRPIHEIITGFSCIDPKGAGSTGINYWQEIITMEKMMLSG